MNWYKKAKELDIKELEKIVAPKWQDVQSSFIKAIAYYEPLKLLEVKMKNGKTYTFGDVPESVYEEFMQSPSKGAFFNSVIRDKY